MKWIIIVLSLMGLLVPQSLLAQIDAIWPDGYDPNNVRVFHDSTYMSERLPVLLTEGLTLEALTSEGGSTLEEKLVEMQLALNESLFRSPVVDSVTQETTFLLQGMRVDIRAEETELSLPDLSQVPSGERAIAIFDHLIATYGADHLEGLKDERGSDMLYIVADVDTDLAWAYTVSPDENDFSKAFRICIVSKRSFAFLHHGPWHEYSHLPTINNDSEDPLLTITHEDGVEYFDEIEGGWRSTLESGDPVFDPISGTWVPRRYPLGKRFSETSVRKYLQWKTEVDGAILRHALPTSVAIAQPEMLPETFTLQGNHPNPFTTSTTIHYALSQPGQVRLVVVDLLGREVAVLVDEMRSAGQHAFPFNADQLPSGVYVYRLETRQGATARKMILAK